MDAPKSEADNLIALAAMLTRHLEELGGCVVNNADASRDLGGVVLELIQRVGALERLVRELARGQCAGSIAEPPVVH
jgi:hypothetical protein